MAAQNLLVNSFEEQEFCDVKFVAEDKVIGAHKMVLKSECKLLFDLSANWTLDKDPINIVDIGFDSFKDFLRYVNMNFTYKIWLKCQSM